jgi:hypothetical protein
LLKKIIYSLAVVNCFPPPIKLKTALPLSYLFSVRVAFRSRDDFFSSSIPPYRTLLFVNRLAHYFLRNIVVLYTLQQTFLIYVPSSKRVQATEGNVSSALVDLFELSPQRPFYPIGRRISIPLMNVLWFDLCLKNVISLPSGLQMILSCATSLILAVFSAVVGSFSC